MDYEISVDVGTKLWDIEIVDPDCSMTCTILNIFLVEVAVDGVVVASSEIGCPTVSIFFSTEGTFFSENIGSCPTFFFTEFSFLHVGLGAIDCSLDFSRSDKSDT